MKPEVALLTREMNYEILGRLDISFVIRYRHVLRPSWRIKYGDIYFNITSIDPDEKNEFMFITVEEVV